MIVPLGCPRNLPGLLFSVLASAAVVLIDSGAVSFAQTADQKREQAIKDKLAAPPLFLDEKHPGPNSSAKGPSEAHISAHYCPKQQLL